MKYLKMLGLAALAAMGLMAFVGASTASATTLSTDAAGTVKYKEGTVIESTLKSGTSAVLATTGGSTIATCTESTVSGAIDKEKETGTWVEGSISTLDWGGCNQTTDTTALGKLKIMQSVLIDKNEKGEVIAETKDRGEVVGVGSKVTLNVFGTTCTYGTGEGTTLGTITGGEAPVLSINANVPKVEGNFLCPGSGVWTATYIVTKPHAVHIVE